MPSRMQNGSDLTWALQNHSVHHVEHGWHRRGQSWKQGDQLEGQEETMVARTGEKVERAGNDGFVREVNLTELADGLD